MENRFFKLFIGTYYFWHKLYTSDLFLFSGQIHHGKQDSKNICIFLHSPSSQSRLFGKLVLVTYDAECNVMPAKCKF